MRSFLVCNLALSFDVSRASKEDKAHTNHHHNTAGNIINNNPYLYANAPICTADGRTKNLDAIVP